MSIRNIFKIYPNDSFAFAVIGIIVVGLVGYANNVIKFMESTSDGTMCILRGIGIFVLPLGSIIGYF